MLGQCGHRRWFGGSVVKGRVDDEKALNHAGEAPIFGVGNPRSLLSFGSPARYGSRSPRKTIAISQFEIPTVVKSTFHHTRSFEFRKLASSRSCLSTSSASPYHEPSGE